MSLHKDNHKLEDLKLLEVVLDNQQEFQVWEAKTQQLIVQIDQLRLQYREVNKNPILMHE